jgi:outer membrane protein
MTALSLSRLFPRLAPALLFALLLPVAHIARAELPRTPFAGVGVRTLPVYNGSDSQYTDAVPLLRYYGSPWFVRSTQGVLEGGARWEALPGFYLGAQLAYEAGRQPQDSDFLKDHEIHGIDPGASAGVHFEWDHEFGRIPLTVVGRVRQGVKSERGLQFDLRASVGVLELGPFSAGLFLQQTSANAKAVNYLYGVSESESVRSGLPVYKPDGGALFLGYGILWAYDITPRWVALGSLESRRVRDVAAESPLIERSSNFYGIAGIAYRF